VTKEDYGRELRGKSAALLKAAGYCSIAVWVFVYSVNNLYYALEVSCFLLGVAFVADKAEYVPL
jgi:hypothetical protein